MRVIVLLCVVSAAMVFGVFYGDDFEDGTLSTKWLYSTSSSNTNKIGREGFYQFEMGAVTLSETGGQLVHNNGNAAIDVTGGQGNTGAWCAHKTVLTNEHYSANEYSPFGVSLRLKSWFNLVGSAPTPAARVSLWALELLQHNKTSYNYPNLGDNFDNVAQLMNVYREPLGRGYWGCYVNGIDYEFEFTNAVMADGVSVTNVAAAFTNKCSNNTPPC